MVMILRHDRKKKNRTRKGGSCRLLVVVLLTMSLLIEAQSQSDSQFHRSIRSKSSVSQAGNDRELLNQQALVSSNQHNFEEAVRAVALLPFNYAPDIRVCDKVVLEFGLVSDNQGPIDVKTFYCVVAGTATSELDGLPPDFEEEWREARNVGKTQLFLSGSTMNGNQIVLPEDDAENGFFRRWRLPLSSTPLSMTESNTRSLAVNQINDKNVVVFRVTVIHDNNVYEPSNTSAEVSSAVFGTGASDVSLKSQYAACSYDKLSFHLSDAISSIEHAPGVVEIDVIPTEMTHTSVAFAVQEKATSILGLNFDDYDYVIFHLPPSVTYKGFSNWTGGAQTPGKYSYYSDENVIDVQTLVHEVGHNLGLYHSGADGDSYGDLSGYMGGSINGQNNMKKCFNAAKSYELGWYTEPNRVFSFNPMSDEEYNGKLIGVADYGISTGGYTLILKIVVPDLQESSYFLMYNRKKGINGDVPEAADKVTIVRGQAGTESVLIAELSPDSTYVLPDFHNGRNLNFIVGAAGQSGDIDYVDLCVKQEIISCAEDSTCTQNLNNCASAVCLPEAYCHFAVTADCCGDGYCDVSEHCSNCPQDCAMSTHCNEVEDVTGTGYFGEGAHGFMFDVKALTDIGVYDIDVVLADTTPATNVKVYSKLLNNTLQSYDNLDQDWDLVFDDQSSGTMILSGPQFTPAGSTRKFYVAFPSGGLFVFGSNTGSQLTNQDIEIDNVSVRGEVTFSTIGLSLQDVLFFGGLKYTYENLIPIDPGLPGASYWKDTGSNITKDFDFNEDSTLILSMNLNGDMLAVSGVAGDNDVSVSYAHYYKIIVYKENPVTEELQQIGDPIQNNVTSYFKDDARADISLSGDGKRLAVAVVNKARRFIFDEPTEGYVRIYSHTLLSYTENWIHIRTMFEGTAGSGGIDIGLRVSLDQYGDKIAIGEMYHDSNSGNLDNDSGRVKVYDANTLAPIGSDLTGNGGDFAGTRVMISRNGQCVIYGATGASGTYDSGVAYIYCLDASGTDWVIRDTLHGEADADQYGYSVAITSDADYVAVGAIGNDVGDTKKNAGHVRVFCYDGSKYTQLGPDVDGTSGETDWSNYYVGDASGSDIALSDVNQDGILRIIIGSPNNMDGGYYAGEVRLFEWNVNFSSVWNQVGSDLNGSKEMAGLGYSVVIDNVGDKTAVSSKGEDLGDSDSGPTIRVFEEDITTVAPSTSPSISPTDEPSSMPSSTPSSTPSISPTDDPSSMPSSTPSSTPSISPTDDPSSMPSSAPSSTPSSQPSSVERDFQIRTTYDKYNSTVHWCATAESISDGAMIKNRPCKFPDWQGQQVFKRDEFGQIKLARIGQDLCIGRASQVFKMSLVLCDTGISAVDDKKKFTLSDDEHTWTVTNNGKTFFVGFETDRMFSRLRLYQSASLNPSIKLWGPKYGPIFD